MGFTDNSFIFLGSYIQGLEPTNPRYMSFGSSSVSFNGSEDTLLAEFLRKPVVWIWQDYNIQAYGSILTVDGNGSDFHEFGLVQNSVDTDDDLYTRDLVSISTKGSTTDWFFHKELRFSAR